MSTQALVEKLHSWKRRRDEEMTRRNALAQQQAEAFDPLDRAPFIRRANQITRREVTEQFKPELLKLADEGRALQEAKRAAPSTMNLITMWAMKEPAMVSAVAALVETKGPAECEQMARQQLAEMQGREFAHSDAAVLAVLMTRVGRMRKEDRPFDPVELANAVKLPGYEENARHLSDARRKLEQFEREWIDLYRDGSISGLTKVRNAVDAGALDTKGHTSKVAAEDDSSTAKISRGLAETPAL